VMAMRAHIVVAEEMIEAVDRVAGKRSSFVEDAIREKLRRDSLTDALSVSAGILAESAYPEWGTATAVSDWVAERRGGDSERLDRKLDSTHE